MPVVRYESKTSEHFQRCSWDSAITLKDEETLPNRMQRAASIAYPVDTEQHRDQSLLDLFLPNKVEHTYNSKCDQLSVISHVVDPNENPRRHSSGNCETIPSKSQIDIEALQNNISGNLNTINIPNGAGNTNIANYYSRVKRVKIISLLQQQPSVPPPIPDRINKVPAIPKRRSLPKLPLENFPTSSSLSVTPTSTLEKGTRSCSPSKPATNSNTSELQQMKLPPPPQPQSTHSKRMARNKELLEEAKTQASRNESKYDADKAEKMANAFFPEMKPLTPLQNIALYNNLQNKSTAEEGYFRFPKVETFPSPVTEDSKFEAYSHTRRKSGKKIPPPIHTYANQSIDDPIIDGNNAHFSDLSKAPTRHDSTLSCSDGGTSQTSSPSYIVRSLESPLLPKVKTHSNNRHTKRKFLGDKLFADINEYSMPKDANRLSPPDLSKSQSTPCGLQTVVNYQQGGSLPYHHRVIKDESGASYFSTGQLKFQFVQIVINVIVLVVVCGSLVGIFKAYPHVTTVHHYYQNISVKPRERHDSDFHRLSDDEYRCEPLTVQFCIDHHVPYNRTTLPFTVHQRDAELDLETYEAITNIRCYQLAPLYLCSLYLPKCGPYSKPVKPCKSLCLETNRRCGIFLKIFGLQPLGEIDCSTLPDSDDPNECVGDEEVKDHLQKEAKVVCHDGFQCDKYRCIPQDWKCDGHIDCADESDEKNCKVCPGQLHCGNGQCYATQNICDGEVSCFWGQDERNCLRLSEQMGDVGVGNVEIFVAENKQFRTACITSWDQQNSPGLMCELLGYTHSNHTVLVNKTEPAKINYIQFNKETKEKNKNQLFRELRKCEHNGSFPTIKAECSTYECGVRKQSLPGPTTRIVGGKASNPGDWPFLAAILGGPMEIFYCAGVLISDQWVLSAAHCIGNFNTSHPPDEWTIQLGITRRSSHSYFGQILKVKRVIPHPNYNVGIPHNNDIALFQLEKRVKFHDHLLPVCMPKRSLKLEPERNCTVIGWGKTEDNNAVHYEPTVNEVQVPILERELCNRWLKHRDLNVSPSMICAGLEKGGKDACQGDSGGPLLCRENDAVDKWFVGGIVSWGIRCANPHLPGIYANVPSFVDWIEKQMEKYSQLKKH